MNQTNNMIVVNAWNLYFKLSICMFLPYIADKPLLIYLDFLLFKCIINTIFFDYILHWVHVELICYVWIWNIEIELVIK